jgi:hypothetical protein
LIPGYFDQADVVGLAERALSLVSILMALERFLPQKRPYVSVTNRRKALFRSLRANT